MDALFRYAIVPALACVAGALAIGFFETASLRDVLAAWSEPEIVRIDSAAAAHIDEDLDYRIAQRNRSLKGWRSFLAAHENGVYAHSASAEVERLRLVSDAPVRPDTPPAGASPETKVETVASGEARESDGKSPEQPLGASVSPEAPRSANDPVPGALRPQLASAVESVESAPQASKVETASPVAAVPETKVASIDSAAAPPVAAPPMPPARMSLTLDRSSRSAGPSSKARPTASLRHRPGRHAGGCAFKFLCFRRAPPILLALMGEKPKLPAASRQNLASASPNSVRYK